MTRRSSRDETLLSRVADVLRGDERGSPRRPLPDAGLRAQAAAWHASRTGSASTAAFSPRETNSPSSREAEELRAMLRQTAQQQAALLDVQAQAQREAAEWRQALSDALLLQQGGGGGGSRTRGARALDADAAAAGEALARPSAPAPALPSTPHTRSPDEDTPQPPSSRRVRGGIVRRQSEVSSLIRERTRQQRAEEEEEEERRQQAAVTPVLAGLQHRQPPPRVSWVPLPSSTPLPPASRWRADDEGDGEEEEEEYEDDEELVAAAAEPAREAASSTPS